VTTLAKSSRLTRRGTGERQLPAAKEEPENGEVDRGCDEWCDPDGYAETKREAEDVAEAEEESEPDDDTHDRGDSLHDSGAVRT
jgi:hypothetical protein